MDISTTYKQLKELELSNKYVFHGSIKQLSILEIKQPFNHGEKDGDPAVCATTNIDTALFMAIYRGAQQLITEKSRSGYGDSYYATKNVLDLVPKINGYIYVLPRGSFEKYKKEEYRSQSSIKPELVITVGAKDFPYKVNLVEL